MPTGFEKVEKTCAACGAAFTIRRRREMTQKYCSRECMLRHEAVHGREAAQVQSTEFACKTCGNSFSLKPSIVRAYEKKFGKLPLYCSRQCAYTGRKADNEATQQFACEQCGKTVARKRYSATGRVKYYTQQRFCGYECKVAWQIAEAGRKFARGDYGRHIKRNGYVWITVPSAITGKKHEMLEHRYVMQGHLGRKLYPEETVHHIDGNRQHNAIENLELFSSRHGPGQRVVDKVAFAIDMLRLYPDFAAKAGVKLVDVDRDA